MTVIPENVEFVTQTIFGPKNIPKLIATISTISDKFTLKWKKTQILG